MTQFDIVTLLRTADGFDLVSETMNKAADEIERLRAIVEMQAEEMVRLYEEVESFDWQVERLRNALFTISSMWDTDCAGDDPIWVEVARAALGEKE